MFPTGGVSCIIPHRVSIVVRNSVLTSILSESLGGDSKTVMLLQINPAVVCRAVVCRWLEASLIRTPMMSPVIP